MLSVELPKYFPVYKIFIKVYIHSYKKIFTLLTIIGSKNMSPHDLRKAEGVFEDWGKRERGR